MIRLKFDDDLPMLGMVGQEGDRTCIVLNHRLLSLMLPTDREDLFNTLMHALENQRGKVIELDDLRSRRQGNHLCESRTRQASD